MWITLLITPTNSIKNAMPKVPRYCPCCLRELWFKPETGMYFCPDWFVCDFESSDDGKPDAFGQQPLTLNEARAEHKRRLDAQGWGANGQ